MNDEKPELTRERDKVFPHSDEAGHEKVIFRNRHGIALTADLYRPKGARGPLAMVTVSGSFGVVKEQSSSLYAQIMTERGFLTLAFDPSCAGESDSAPHYMASPDTNIEDFSAVVGHLSCREDVDPGRIDIIGICGWGGIATNAVALDPRIRTTVASTMYGMSRITAKGYFDEQDPAVVRNSVRTRLAAQRTAGYRSGSYMRAGGVVDPLFEDIPVFVRGYHDHYKTPRGYHLRSLNSDEGWNTVGTASFLDQPPLTYTGEIRTPVLVVHDGKTYSHYMGKGAFTQLTGENKELLIIPGASHTDLYDGGGRDAIPFDRITEFFRTDLVWAWGLAITSRPPGQDRIPAPPRPECGSG